MNKSLPSKRVFSRSELAHLIGIDEVVIKRLMRMGVVNALSDSDLISIDEEELYKFIDGYESEQKNSSDARSLQNKKPTVLIIEDEEIVASGLKRIFNHLGFHSLHTDNGFKVPRLIKEYAPSVVTVDLRMDVINGASVVKMLNKLENRNHFIVIVISGEDEEMIKNIVTQGADFYLTKPYEKINLEKIVSKFKLSKNRDIA